MSDLWNDRLTFIPGLIVIYCLAPVWFVLQGLFTFWRLLCHLLSKTFNHPREQGAGVAVTRYWKAGNVAYAKIPALQGLDLSCYRGKAREEVRVMKTT